MKKKIVGGEDTNSNTKTLLITLGWLFCGALYILFFYALYHNQIPGQKLSTPVGQLYSYIVIFMLNIFFGVFILFLFKDNIFEGFTYTLFEQSDDYEMTFWNVFNGDSAVLLKSVVLLFVLGYLTEFISLVIVLVVFGYAFKNKIPNSGQDSYEMSPVHMTTLYQYNDVLLCVRVALFFMLFLFTYHYLNPTTNMSQNMIRNILLSVCALIILICGFMQYWYSVKFLQVKLRHEDLFIGIPGST
jgi:hypothetical protein